MFVLYMNVKSTKIVCLTPFDCYIIIFLFEYNVCLSFCNQTRICNRSYLRSYLEKGDERRILAPKHVLNTY